MSILIVVGHPDSGDILIGLAGACSRLGQPYQCFFTGDGVRQLEAPAVLAVLDNAEKAVVCELSWARQRPGRPAPIEQGSQTDHSAMAGTAQRLVSL